MLCDMDQVTAVRFILRQPSPVWLHFTIEELQIFPPGQKVSGCPCCPPCQMWGGVLGQATTPSPTPGIAPHSSRGVRHPPEDTEEGVQVPVLRWGTWGPLVRWGPGEGRLQPAPALPVLVVDVCLSSGVELEVAAPNYRLQTPKLYTKFPLITVKRYLYPYQRKYRWAPNCSTLHGVRGGGGMGDTPCVTLWISFRAPRRISPPGSPS